MISSGEMSEISGENNDCRQFLPGVGGILFIGNENENRVSFYETFPSEFKRGAMG